LFILNLKIELASVFFYFVSSYFSFGFTLDPKKNKNKKQETGGLAVLFCLPACRLASLPSCQPA
jgi:hypothetical protein